MIQKIINFLKNKFSQSKSINTGIINSSEINSMTISADIVSVNTDYGHFEIGGKTGFTGKINGVKFVGGICVGLEEDTTY